MHCIAALPKSSDKETTSVGREKRVAQEVEGGELWREPDEKPTFTFRLRPRLIQSGIGVKLLCCLSGRPMPNVQWFKDDKPIDEKNAHYAIEYGAGVCTLDIASSTSGDTGTYKCRAENALGADETACFITIQGKFSSPLLSSPLLSSSLLFLHLFALNSTHCIQRANSTPSRWLSCVKRIRTKRSRDVPSRADPSQSSRSSPPSCRRASSARSAK